MAMGDSYCDMIDEYYDFPCRPCEKEGRNTSAEKFCVDCKYLLCSTCLGHHNKFDILKCHQILDKTASVGQASPTLQCEKHSGKVLDMFCMTHDEPCCIDCASKDHSDCKGKEVLIERARSYFTDKELQTVKTSACKIKRTLENVKKKWNKGLDEISDQKTSILIYVREKRDAVNKRFDTMEKDVKEKLEKKYSQYSDDLKVDIEAVNELVEKIEDYQDKSVSAIQNIADAFIIMKKLNQLVAEGAQFQKSRHSETKALQLIGSCAASSILASMGSDVFGYISGSGRIESVVADKIYCIRANDDTSICCISDSCLMEDGTIILADQNNRKLKRLDNTFRLKDTLVLSGKPCAVCPTGASEVAVSLLNKSSKSIVSVKIASLMSVTSSFRIGESCRGIAFCNDNLYLSCGGMFKYNDGPGEIRIYDKLGSILCKMDEGVRVPKRMSIGTNKFPHDLYVADGENGVLCLNTSVSGLELRDVFKDENLKGAVGLCYAEKGQVIVSGYDSENIMLMTENGQFKEIMSKRDGIAKPKTICLDQTKSKLMIGMNDLDVVRVVHVIRE